MQKKFDYYEELEVARKATPEEIKDSYRRLALVTIFSLDSRIEVASWQECKLHWIEREVPTNWRSLRWYLRISAFGLVLSNKKKRKEYDEFGHIDENDEEFSDFLNNLDFTELTSMLFGDLLFPTDKKKHRHHPVI